MPNYVHGRVEGERVRRRVGNEQNVDEMVGDERIRGNSRER